MLIGKYGVTNTLTIAHYMRGELGELFIFLLICILAQLHQECHLDSKESQYYTT